jgi:hypothetical protein
MSSTSNILIQVQEALDSNRQRAKDRLDICNVCENKGSTLAGLEKCNLCHCILKAMTLIPNKKCMMGKW